MTAFDIAKGPDTAPLPDPIPMLASEYIPANPFTELGIATAILIVIIVVHGWCLGRVSRFFSTHFALYTPGTPRWRVSGLTALTIALLVLIHFVETLLWTIPLLQLGMLDNFRNAYYFVLEAYTTLGEGTIALPEEWRLVGPVIAISGLFTFGWTASVLVYVMNEIGKLHQQTSLAEAGVETHDGDRAMTKKDAVS